MKKIELFSSKMSEDQKIKIREVFPELFDGDNFIMEKFKISIENIEEQEVLYHYTSIDILEKILTESIGKKYFILRGTHIEYLNDYQELKLAIENMQHLIEEFERNGNDKQNKELSKNLNYNKWKTIINWGGLLTDFYITSFSENSDSLPMWNIYGNNGNGVAIGCKKTHKETKNERTRWGKCFYSTDRFKKLFNDKVFQIIYDNIDFENGNLSISGDLVFNNLSFYFGILKHASYEFEKEWRLMKQLNIERNTIKFHPSNGILKPFVENKFSKSDLKKIVLGPCADKELSERSVKMLLQNAGFSTNRKDENFVEVIISQAPYRII